ncbi:MAG: cobalt transporter CbiM [Proteobacteria bacterium]|nr:cobalt transporter CbiM [Pseudomonadota bacterium]
MHIPDNYLSPSTCAIFGSAMLPIWTIAIKKIKKELSPQKLPVLGIFSAFSFLLMMLNIPLPGGTTGHAVGATLIAILIGPFAACISMTIALFVQAVFFGDGGILTFGVNSFNMAFVMPFSGYYIYRLLKNLNGNSRKGNLASIFIASYVSINIAAFIAAIQFGIQPLLFKDASGLPLYAPYPLSISIPAMMIPHLLITGLIEAIVAMGVYSYINKLSPEIIYGNKPNRLKPVYAMLILMAILSPLGLLASGTAWGEWGNQELKKMLGYIPSGVAKGFSFNSIMPGYVLPSIGNQTVAYVICAILGLSIILISFKFVASYIQK